MKVLMAEIIALGPFGVDNMKAGFAGIVDN
jgi:hypothetical protein